MPEVRAELFGFRNDGPISEGEIGDQVTLMMEDDGFWHDKLTFHSCWLPDLLKAVNAAMDMSNMQVFPKDNANA